MTISNSDLVRQLVDWLSETDIARLELRGPGESICLQREGGRIVVAPDEPALATEDAPSVAATAASVGVFLHRHPLRETALAPIGTRVVAGQPLGLLQVGALLLPLCAPRAGTVTGLRVAHGTAVGYGTPLVELAPL